MLALVPQRVSFGMTEFPIVMGAWDYPVHRAFNPIEQILADQIKAAMEKDEPARA